jgi:ligand-binding sensor domain-containing protein/serine phosphatase RsbU (regulator of sigma subunit)
MTRQFTIVFLLLFCLIKPGLFSQQNNFYIFSIQEGLPNSSVFTIFQDSRGIIWLGTQGGGLIRFEGKEFQSYTTNDGLFSNSIRAITEDRNGNLWLGTDGGLNLFNGITIAGFENIPGLYDEPILSLLEDEHGDIWAGTRNSGLIRIYKVEKDTLLSEKFNTENGLSSNFIFSLYEDNRGRIWAGTYGQGINILTHSDTTITIENLLPGINIPAARIVCMEEDTAGNIWIGSTDAGVFCIVKNREGTKTIKKLPEMLNLGQEIIWSILSDSRGNLWLGTSEKGAVRLSGNKIVFFSDSLGMPGNQVYDMLEDFEGNLWFSTFGNGICRYGGDHFAHYTEYDGLSDNLVSDIEQDMNGYLWIATHGGGLNVIDPDVTVPDFITYGDEVGLGDISINDIAIGKDGSFWIATSGDGIAFFNGKKFVYLTENENLINDYVNCLYIDEMRNLLWCGTRGGISIFNGTGFLNIHELSDPALINNEVQHIIQDRKGSIWVATLGGLVKFYEGTMTDFDEEEGLYYKKLHTLAEDNDGNIWIGTFGGGLFMFDIQADSMPISLAADNTVLSSNNIYSLIFLDDTTLLAGTDRGLDRITLDSENKISHVKNYNQSDGFKGLENQLNAVFKDQSGNVWFGTVGGLTRYNPKAEHLISEAPLLHLTDIDLFYQDVNWNEKSDSIKPWYRIPYELELPYSSNNLTFKCVAISNTNPDKITYQFYLDGLDKDFTPPTINNEITYSGLKPGQYTLNVIATNVNQITSEPLQYSFVINPPFWQTWWFYSIIIILIALGIFSYIKYRERQLIKKNRELEMKVLERTAEIRRQKSVIEEKNKNLEIANIEISEQKNIIEAKNRDITDSIKYAQRIQNALLPSYELLKESFADSFILFKPRDIVSGDFYWVKKINGEVIVVAADCTGHGVPGAFMSMLGISFLNEIVDKNNITEPGRILNLLRESVITSLKQRHVESETRDGMDIALCKISHDQNKLWYAGANNPLWLIRNSEFTEQRADRMPIAIYDEMNEFTTHTIKLQKDDSIYMFSDGYADQFGGPKGKKFKYRPLQELLISLQEKKMEEQKEILNKTIEEWRGDFEQIDDIIIMGLKY